MNKINIIIPTYNGGKTFVKLAKSLLRQKMIQPQDILIVDSSSTDNTVENAKKFGFKIITIDKKNFGHGKTRRFAVKNIYCDIAVFLTQDVLPYTEDAIIRLCSVFSENEKIGAVYGRQIPYKESGFFGAHARLFNYSNKNLINRFGDREKKGLKTAFLSDSFAAYKMSVLLDIGNFPDVSFGEDTCVAAKMLMKGYETAYIANAIVYHSHDYGILEEFKRYEAIGEFHQKEKWLVDTFGKAEGEGFRFVKSEIRYLIINNKEYLIPMAFLRNFCKYVGYFYGRHHNL
jgi:rhamnosyltransferase